MTDELVNTAKPLYGGRLSDTGDCPYVGCPNPGLVARLTRQNAELREWKRTAQMLGPEKRICADSPSRTINSLIAERDEALSKLAASERRGKMMAGLLISMREEEWDECPICQQSGQLYRDHKLHHASDNAPTVACYNCGGTGFIMPDWKERIRIALAAQPNDSAPAPTTNYDEYRHKIDSLNREIKQQNILYSQLKEEHAKLEKELQQ